MKTFIDNTSKENLKDILTQQGHDTDNSDSIPLEAATSGEHSNIVEYLMEKLATCSTNLEMKYFREMVSISCFNSNTKKY